MHPRLLLLIVLLCITLPGIGIDLYSPSLPNIATSFQVSAALAKITISAYLLGFALGQILFGTLSDVYGRKPILLIGVGLYCFASLAAPFTHHIYLLFALRFCQGFGAGAASAVPKTLLTDSLSGKALTEAFAYLLIVWGLGPIVAPVIGSYLQFHFNWQANFYFYAAQSGLLWLIMLFFLKETHFKRIPLPTKQVIHNYWQLLQHPIYVSGILLLGLGYSMIIAFHTIGAFLIQVKLGYSSITYGHLALVVGSGYLIAGFLNRVGAKYFAPQTISTIGLITIIIPALVMLILSYTLPFSAKLIVIPVTVMVSGVGLLIPHLMSRCMTLFPHIAGTASAAMGGFFVLCAFLTSLIVSQLPTSSLIPTAHFFLILAILQGALYLLIFIRQFPRVIPR